MATEISSRIARLRRLASFEPRPLRPGFSGREPFDWPEQMRKNRQRILDQAAEPYVGITTDGSVQAGLFEIGPTGVSNTHRENICMEIRCRRSRDVDG